MSVNAVNAAPGRTNTPGVVKCRECSLSVFASMFVATLLYMLLRTSLFALDLLSSLSLLEVAAQVHGKWFMQAVSLRVLPVIHEVAQTPQHFLALQLLAHFHFVV